MSNLVTFIGKRIRTIRKIKGYTQEELAERSGLQHTYIGGVERGERNISLETLEKIVIGLGIKPKDLFIYNELNSSEEGKKLELIDGYRTLLIDRSIEEITMVHRVVQDILTLLDNKNKS